MKVHVNLKLKVRLDDITGNESIETLGKLAIDHIINKGQYFVNGVHITELESIGMAKKISKVPIKYFIEKEQNEDNNDGDNKNEQEIYQD